MIRWDEAKNQRLKRERHMSFERVSEAISRGEYLDVLKHPRRPNQRIFVVRLGGYIWLVPYVLEQDGETIFLKTAFPSRKFNRQYGGKSNA